VDWSEFELAARTVIENERSRLHAGVRWMTISADESGSFEGSRASGDFDPEDELGLFAGAEYDLNEQVSARFRVNFVDETAFRLGVVYQF
jgi:hypothetical protein